MVPTATLAQCKSEHVAMGLEVLGDSVGLQICGCCVMKVKVRPCDPSLGASIELFSGGSLVITGWVEPCDPRLGASVELSPVAAAQ